ncbi:Tyrosine recombinase XerC [Anaerolineae bacterium]|nr:Tyrosine recombinase XerC [Anaerolineae bacterium]
MLFVNARERFLLDCKARALSPNTIERYTNDLSTLERFISIRNVFHLEEITPDLLREFVAHLLARRHRYRADSPISPFTVDGIYRSCRTFFVFCAREDFLQINPMERVRHIKLPQRLVPRLSEDQVYQLIKEVEKTKLPKRNLAMILLLADSGLRRSEMLNLAVDDVHLDEGYVRVVGKGNKQREVPIGKAARKAIRIWLKARPYSKTQSVFVNSDGTPFRKNGLGSLFRRLRKYLGLKRLYPHLLRHTFAKMYLRRSHDHKALQNVLGHSRSSTTLDLYVDYDIEDLKEIHRFASPVDAILKSKRKR